MGFRQTFSYTNDVITFGKYNGNSIEYILQQNPSYLVWLHEEGAIALSNYILNIAKEKSELERFNRAVRYLQEHSSSVEDDMGQSPYDCDDKGGDWTGYGTSWWW